MKRAMCIALGMGALISSAAGIGIGASSAYAPQAISRDQIAIATSGLDQQRMQDSARGAQRARVEARYDVERAKCAEMGGARRDRCLIDAHATRGGTLLELAAPYDNRS